MGPWSSGLEPTGTKSWSFLCGHYHIEKFLNKHRNLVAGKITYFSMLRLHLTTYAGNQTPRSALLLVVQGIPACVRSRVSYTAVVGNSSCSLPQPAYSSTSPSGVQVLLVPKVETTVVLTKCYKQRSVCNFLGKYTGHFSSVFIYSMKTSTICIDFCMDEFGCCT